MTMLIDRDSSDDSRSGVNIRVFPAFLQDSREGEDGHQRIGQPERWSGADLCVFREIAGYLFAEEIEADVVHTLRSSTSM